MSLDTWRPCLLNQKVRFVTGEVGGADSALPPGGLALLAVCGVGGVEGGPLSGSWLYAHLWRGPLLRVAGGRPQPSQWMLSCSRNETLQTGEQTWLSRMPRSGVRSSSGVGRFVPHAPGQVTPALETFLRRWNPGFPGSSSPLGRCGCGDVRLPPGLQRWAQDDLGLGPDTFYPVPQTR